MQKKALPMSHNAANLAVMQENKQETMQAELQENYLKLHVPNVAAHVKFHFSLATIVLFTAVIALQTKDKCASLLEKLLDSFSHPLGVFYEKCASFLLIRKGSAFLLCVFPWILLQIKVKQSFS